MPPQSSGQVGQVSPLLQKPSPQDVTVQSVRQPSLLVVLPSSHSSNGKSTVPSPQNEVSPEMLWQLALHTVHDGTP
jgi:hypothetical protein